MILGYLTLLLIFVLICIVGHNLFMAIQIEDEQWEYERFLDVLQKERSLHYANKRSAGKTYNVTSYRTH
jgi:hypothetical protein